MTKISWKTGQNEWKTGKKGPFLSILSWIWGKFNDARPCYPLATPLPRPKFTQLPRHKMPGILLFRPTFLCFRTILHWNGPFRTNLSHNSCTIVRKHKAPTLRALRALRVAALTLAHNRTRIALKSLRNAHFAAQNTRNALASSRISCFCFAKFASRTFWGEILRSNPPLRGESQRRFFGGGNEHSSASRSRIRFCRRRRRVNPPKAERGGAPPALASRAESPAC